MWILAAAALAQAASPFAGLEVRPLSRGDLVWVEEQRTSGFAVGELDGTVRPNLQAYGGVWWNRIALSGAVGVARLQNTTQVNEVVSHRHWGVIRPSIDLRWALTDRAIGRPFPYLIAGIHGDIPSARDLSNAYTEAERESADEAATVARGRLGGFGARGGIGAEYRITESVSFGAMYTLQWHRGLLRAGDRAAVSQWLAAEASLLLVFEWPRPAPDPPPDPNP